MVGVWGNCWSCGHHRVLEGSCELCQAVSGDDPLLGKVLGPVKISRHLVSEPESSLYHGVAEGRRVMVRVLPHKLHGDAASISAFVQVSRRASALDHPNIASITKHGVSQQGVAWAMMEGAEGRNFSELLYNNPQPALPLERAHKVSLQLLMSVQDLHGAGLVHGRLSPFAFEWMGAADDWVRLLHCGHGWMRQNDGGFSGGLSKRSGWRGLRPWAMYRAPSLFHQGEINEHVDLYSVGVCIYQVFTGRLPYRVNRDSDILKLLRAGKPLELLAAGDRRAELGRYPALLNVLSKALDEREGVRFRSVRDFAEAMKVALIERIQGDAVKPVEGRKSTSRGAARENIRHQAASRQPHLRDEDASTPGYGSGRPGPRPKSSPLNRDKSRKGITAGVRHDDLDRLGRSLAEMSHEAAAVLSPINAEGSLRALEAAIMGVSGPPAPSGPGPSSSIQLHSTSQRSVSTGSFKALSADDATWAVVCLSSPQLKARPRGTLQSVTQLDYRAALEPLRLLSERMTEVFTSGDRGALLCFMGPATNLGALLGPLVVFLMEFERTRKAEPPAVTVAVGRGPREPSKDELEPAFQSLAAEVQALLPVARSGELIARPEVLKALGMEAMCGPVPFERAAPIDPLVLWPFISRERA